MTPRLGEQFLHPAALQQDCLGGSSRYKPFTCRFFKTADGVKVQELAGGAGAEAKSGDLVTLDYVLRSGTYHVLHQHRVLGATRSADCVSTCMPAGGQMGTSSIRLWRA